MSDKGAENNSPAHKSPSDPQNTHGGNVSDFDKESQSPPGGAAENRTNESERLERERRAEKEAVAREGEARSSAEGEGGGETEEESAYQDSQGEKLPPPESDEG